MMKLVFPDGDRPQMLLEQRVYRIGSAPDADVALVAEGLEPLHCELQVGAQGVQVRVPNGIRVLVNGRPVEGLIALRAGDTLGLAAARIRLLDAAAEGATASPAAMRSPEGGDRNATVVRPVLPKFVLRGLSGDHFGRSYPLQASLTIGRADDVPACALPSTAFRGCMRGSRRPATRYWLEDLGSANGTWLNGKRITRAPAVHGDEIRVDTQRFQLLMPGQPMRAKVAGTSVPNRWPWPAVMLLAVAGVAYWLSR